MYLKHHVIKIRIWAEIIRDRLMGVMLGIGLTYAKQKPITLFEVTAALFRNSKAFYLPLKKKQVIFDVLEHMEL